MLELPLTLERTGLVLSRRALVANAEIVGDPCVVWDEQARAWRMFLFVQPGGHGHAVCPEDQNPAGANWSYQGPLEIANPPTDSPWPYLKPVPQMVQPVLLNTRLAESHRFTLLELMRRLEHFSPEHCCRRHFIFLGFYQNSCPTPARADTKA